MTGASAFERNSRSAPKLGALLARHESRADEVVTTARDGSVVNGLRIGDRDVLFHSRYSPAAEGDRIAERAGDAGFVVVLGIGMGHHLASFQRDQALFIVEPDARLARSAFERVDLSAYLDRSDVTFTVAAPEDVGQLLVTTYSPALHGDLVLVELPGRAGADRAVFARYRAAIASAIETIKDESAAYARFGARWTRNTMINLPAIAQVALPDFRGRRVTVVAAGPTLEDRMEVVRNADAVIAVDTALPILLDYGVTPDLTVAIDCQQASYHHFLCAGSPAPSTLFDLAIAPSLVHAVGNPALGLSDHPLHRLLRRCGLDLPYLDVRGGNVAQSALAFAATAGAREAILVGADFSYPGGRTYPRGSYIHRHFETLSARLTPLAGLHFAFLASRPDLERDPLHPATLRQPLLTRYASAMADLIAGLPIRVDRVQGAAIDLPPPMTRTSPGTRAYGARRHYPLPDLAGVIDAVIEHYERCASLSVDGVFMSADADVALTAASLIPHMTELRARSSGATKQQLFTGAIEYALEYARAAKRALS